MSPKQAHLLMLGAVLALAAAIFGGAYGTQKILQAKSDQLVSLKAKAQSYQSQQEGLTRAKKDIQQYNDLYTIAKSIVPENKNQAETVRQIVKLASESSVKLGSITFPSSTLGNAVGKTATGSSTSLTTPTAPIGNSNLSQLTPVIGSAGVYVMQITVTSDVSTPSTYPQLISFLSALEHNRLTAEVTNISITPSTNSTSRFSFTLSLNSYIKP
ncbi:MAG: hypothetical protein JWN38_866 [Candidatus Saccharibacteria bacterium]|nr:hypothetical protein [Candidatus Saccharibacteria bacterium]